MQKYWLGCKRWRECGWLLILFFCCIMRFAIFCCDLSWNVPLVLASSSLSKEEKVQSRNEPWLQCPWIIADVFVVSWDCPYLCWKTEFESVTCVNLSLFHWMRGCRYVRFGLKKISLEVGCGKIIAYWCFFTSVEWSD